MDKEEEKNTQSEEKEERLERRQNDGEKRENSEKGGSWDKRGAVRSVDEA